MNSQKLLVLLCVCILALSSYAAPTTPKNPPPYSETETETLVPMQTTKPNSSPGPTSEPPPISTPIPKPIPTPEPTPGPVPEELYVDDVYHIFFHALIAFPEISYRNGSSPLDTDCVTVDEFKRCMEQLHANGYALIAIEETFEVLEDGTVKQRPVIVPAGKKPLILSVDDMVYDPNKMGTGMVDKLFLDEDGKIASYTKHRDGTEIISYDNEVIMVLENFIAVHPDFSIRGARGLLAMTGFAGVFGYRTDRLNANQQSEIESAMPIAEALRELGWTFGSHGYGHRHSADISEGLFLDDTQKWRNEVENMVGATQVYVYPYGQSVTAHGTKYNTMLDFGFKVMCGVSHKQEWVELGDGLYMSRIAVDGYSLRNYGQILEPLFDCKTVIDKEYRR